MEIVRKLYNELYKLEFEEEKTMCEICGKVKTVGGTVVVLVCPVLVLG